MKSLFFVLAMSVFFGPMASANSGCAFGETTADLSEMLDSRAPGKIWYKGEHLSLTKPERLQGLNELEKEMIVSALGEQSRDRREEERLLAFSDSEGYITYFRHNSNRREFAMVASYPGDNEFGVILEIQSARLDGERKILGVAAVISDGDLESCKVFN